MYPTLEKIKEIAQSGEYRRIPVCRELYSDRYTPVEFMRTLRTASRHCYLLESASQTEVWGRYSFLGYEPSMEITCTDGKLQIRMIHEDGTEEKTVQQVKHPGCCRWREKSLNRGGCPTYRGHDASPVHRQQGW